MGDSVTRAGDLDSAKKNGPVVGFSPPAQAISGLTRPPTGMTIPHG